MPSVSAFWRAPRISAGRLAPGRAELPLQRDFAVGGGASDAHHQGQILGAAGDRLDLVEFCLGIERKSPHAKIVVGLGDEAPGFHWMHDVHDRAGKRRDLSDLGKRGHVEMANSSLEQRVEDGRRVVRLHRIEGFAGEILDEPSRRALCRVQAHANHGLVYWNVAEELRSGRVNVHRMGPPI